MQFEVLFHTFSQNKYLSKKCVNFAVAIRLKFDLDVVVLNDVQNTKIMMIRHKILEQENNTSHTKTVGSVRRVVTMRSLTRADQTICDPSRYVLKFQWGGHKRGPEEWADINFLAFNICQQRKILYRHRIGANGAGYVHFERKKIYYFSTLCRSITMLYLCVYLSFQYSMEKFEV